jgi:predicted ArsR family transcriptional regulator
MNFSTEHWANHKKGKAVRQRILEIIQSNPNADTPEIARKVERSQAQVKRHLSTLRIEGKLPVATGTGVFSRGCDSLSGESW